MPLGSTYWRNITVSTSFLCQNDADYWWLDSCLTPWQYLFWWFDQESHWWTYWLNDTLVPHFKHIISWHRPGDKPLPEPVMVSWLTHIYVTRPHWVNYGADRWRIIVLQVTISKELFFVSSIRDNEFTHAISKQRELILAYKKCQNNDIWLGHRLDQRPTPCPEWGQASKNTTTFWTEYPWWYIWSLRACRNQQWYWMSDAKTCVNTLNPKQNGPNFADDIFKRKRGLMIWVVRDEPLYRYWQLKRNW